MSMDPSTAPQNAMGSVAITPRHYQALCGLALAAIFLVQIQQSALTMRASLLVALLVLFIGTVGILYRVRLSPMFVLIALGVPMLIEQYSMNRLFKPDFRALRLDIADVFLCAATLTYLIGQYRLHGLWFGVLPPDKRLPPQARSEESLSAAELAALIGPIPAFALLAEGAVFLMKRQGTVLDLGLEWNQFLVAAWTILLVLFLAAHAFRHWRRLQMDRVSAELLLQDTLWHETRGEQRRINRWLAWQKLRQRKMR